MRLTALASRSAVGAAASQGKVIEEAFMSNSLRLLSVSLCKGNALLFRRELGLLASVAGVDFVVGEAAPNGDMGWE